MLDLGANLIDHYRWDEKWTGWVGSIKQNPLQMFRGTVTTHNPLRAAVSWNFHKIVQLLLAKGADPRHGEKCEEFTPLHNAVQRVYERVAQILLDHGANIDTGRCSPLDLAVRHWNLLMARFLLERGAALKVKLQTGRHSLQLLHREDTSRW